MASGIYMIRCRPSGKVYVGSSVCFSDRWGEHRRKLNFGIHHSKRLQYAWNKYGACNFDFVVLEEVADTDTLVSREQEWMDRLGAYSKNGLNCRPTADSGAWSKETLSKEYIIIAPNGAEMKIKNLREYCRKTGLDQGPLAAVARHRTNHHKSYHCRFATETFETWKSKRKDEIEKRRLARKPRGPKSKGPWEITFPDGRREIVNALIGFAEDHGLSSGNLYDIAKGIRAQHRGFRCRNIGQSDL